MHSWQRDCLMEKVGYATDENCCKENFFSARPSLISRTCLIACSLALEQSPQAATLISHTRDAFATSDDPIIPPLDQPSRPTHATAGQLPSPQLLQPKAARPTCTRWVASGILLTTTNTGKNRARAVHRAAAANSSHTLLQHLFMSSSLLPTPSFIGLASARAG